MRARAQTGGGVLGGATETLESLEAKEVETLRLPLSDDRILDCTIGKTPVMVLQEHCHKHVGKLPTYTDVVDPVSLGNPKALPVYRVTVSLYTGESASAENVVKKKAKQKCALDLLRVLYKHVDLWGELVESTNSRQREAKFNRQEQARKAASGELPLHAAHPSHAASGSLLPPPADGEPSEAATPLPLLVEEGTQLGGVVMPLASDAAASGPLVKVGLTTRQMLNVTRDALWERIAKVNNHAAGRQVIALGTEPIPLQGERVDDDACVS